MNETERVIIIDLPNGEYDLCVADDTQPAPIAQGVYLHWTPERHRLSVYTLTDVDAGAVSEALWRGAELRARISRTPRVSTLRALLESDEAQQLLRAGHWKQFIDLVEDDNRNTDDLSLWEAGDWLWSTTDRADAIQDLGLTVDSTPAQIQAAAERVVRDARADNVVIDERDAREALMAALDEMWELQEGGPSAPWVSITAQEVRELLDRTVARLQRQQMVRYLRPTRTRLLAELRRHGVVAVYTNPSSMATGTLRRRAS